MKAKYLLVLTACIDPSAGVYPLTRANAQDRAKDYADALKWWLAYEDSRTDLILFIENSGYPVDFLRHIAENENPHKKAVEIVALGQINSYPVGGHYGYAEMVMLDKGMAKSKLASRATHIIKVSGRYKFPSLTRLLDRIDARGMWDVVGDCRDGKMPYVTTPLIIFSLDCFNRNFRSAHFLADHRMTHMERVYYWVMAALDHGRWRIMWRFPVNCSPVGTPAHRGSYSGVVAQAKSSLRAVARIVAPGWWV